MRRLSLSRGYPFEKHVLQYGRNGQKTYKYFLFRWKDRPKARNC